MILRVDPKALNLGGVLQEATLLDRATGSIPAMKDEQLPQL